MAPIKFEENMKDKLEERTINPSAKSWDALASRLDEAPVNKKSNRFWFFNVAASVVGVLLLITGIVNYNNKEVTTIVETETETNSETIKDPVKANKGTVLYQDSKKEIIVENTKNSTKTNALKNKLVNRDTEALANITRKTQKVNTKSIKTIKRNKNSKVETIYTNDIALNIKTAGLQDTTIAEQNSLAISNPKNEIIKVTDSELEALLNTAQKNIAKKTSSPVPLDYNELLQDVEDNLEESFRDKILKTVKGGYRSVKSYVAERND